MRYPLLCLFVALPLGAQQLAPANLTAADLRSLRWIEGSWCGSGAEKPFYERYVFADDSTLLVYGVPDSTFTRVSDTTRFELRSRTMGNAAAAGASRWVAVNIEKGAVTFAPAARARNTFVWRPSTPTEWFADLSWPANPAQANSQPRSVTYRMRRCGPLNTMGTAADREAVRRAALDYIEGFYEGDTVKLARAFRPEMFKYGFWRNDAGKYEGERMTFAEAVDYAKKVKARNRPVHESFPKDVVIFEVQDATAAARVTAWWGTDYLLLGKYDGQWQIAHVMWQGPLR